MTTIPAHELPLMDDLVVHGVRVLEFGDKRNPTGLYKTWYEDRGARYVSVDINNRNGAIGLDVRKPFDLGRFGLVTNWGFSEHVSVQEPFWENAYRALAVGGHLVGTLPQPHHWLEHGWSYWHPKKEFYEAWCLLNGCEVVRLEDVGPGNPQKRMWGFVIKKVQDGTHHWCKTLDALIWRNPNWEIPKDETVHYGSA